MGVSRGLRRLLRLREMEEEAGRAALESALGELRGLERARDSARQRERGGRLLLAASARTGELTDRLAGFEETRAGERHRAALEPRIAETEESVIARRQQLLVKRLERRQVETLIEEQEASDATEAGRRTQRGLDDWFLTRARGPQDAESEEGGSARDGGPETSHNRLGKERKET